MVFDFKVARLVIALIVFPICHLSSQTAWLNNPTNKLITISEPINGYIVKSATSEKITTDFSPTSVYTTIQSMLGVSEMVDTTEFTKNWINTKKLEAVYVNKAITAHGELTFVADTGDYISGGVVYCLDVENGDNVRNFIPYRLEKDVLSLVPYSDENYELYRALTFLCFGDFAKAYEENLCIESVKGKKSMNLIELYLRKWESGSLQRKCHW